MPVPDVGSLGDDELVALAQLLAEHAYEISSASALVKAEQVHRSHLKGFKERAQGVGSYGEGVMADLITHAVPSRASQVKADREMKAVKVEEAMSMLPARVAPEVRAQIRSRLEEAPWTQQDGWGVGFVFGLVAPNLTEEEQIIEFGPDPDSDITEVRTRLGQLRTNPAIGEERAAKIDQALTRLNGE